MCDYGRRLFSGEYAWNVFRYRRITVVIDTVHPSEQGSAGDVFAAAELPRENILRCAMQSGNVSSYRIITKLEWTA